MLFGGDGTTTTDFRFCFLKLREAQTEDASMWPSWLLFSPSAAAKDDDDDDDVLDLTRLSFLFSVLGPRPPRSDIARGYER